MKDFHRLLTSTAGIDWALHDDGHKMTLAAQADVSPILERNQAMAGHNNGYSPDKSWRRAASIPLIVLHKWRDEEGWDPFNTSDPDCRKKLMQKLDSEEYRYLRTADFRIGDSWRKGI